MILLATPPGAASCSSSIASCFSVSALSFTCVILPLCSVCSVSRLSYLPSQLWGRAMPLSGLHFSRQRLAEVCWLHSQDGLWAAESRQRKEYVFGPKLGFQLCEGTLEMSECWGYILLLKDTSHILPWPLSLSRDKKTCSLRCFKIFFFYLASLFSLATLSFWKLLLPQFLTIKSSNICTLCLSWEITAVGSEGKWEKVAMTGRSVSGSCPHLPEVAAAVLWQLIHSLWKRHLSLQVSFVLE